MKLSDIEVQQVETRDDTGFSGEFTHSLDAKKRLTIPSVWREKAGETNRFFVMPRGDFKYLALFRVDEMSERLRKLRARSIADPKARQMARVIGNMSEEVSWDTHGRVRIKDKLLEYAGLTGDVYMNGALNCIELWHPKRWAEAVGEPDPMQVEEMMREVEF